MSARLQLSPFSLLAGLRAALGCGLLLILLNPSCSREEADPDAFAYALLGQVSPTMLSADATGGSRLDFVARQFDPANADGLLARLSARHAVQAFVFNDSLHPAGASATWPMGRAALGDALTAMADLPAPHGTQWGGVVLFSDGISTLGQAPVEAARRLGAAGIPVHVVALGDPDRSGSVDVAFAERGIEARVDEPLALALTLHNRFADTRTVRIELAANETPIGVIEATLAAGATQTLSHPWTPRASGPLSLRATVHTPQPGPPQPLAVAHARAEVHGAARSRILYIGRPGPSLRALYPVFAASGWVQAGAWLALGPERWLAIDSSASAERQAQHAALPPPPGPLLDADVLILDGGVSDLLPADWIEAIRAFVGSAGGGLLQLGPPPAAGHPLATLLPGRAYGEAPVRADTPLSARDGALLPHAQLAVFRRHPLPFAAPGLPAPGAEQLRAGARAALLYPDGRAAMAYQGYGAGRVVWLGIDHTWLWALSSEAGMQQHRQLWLAASGWLAEARKPRLDSPLQGAMLPLHEPAQLRIRLLDRAFAPRADARVRALLRAPSGAVGEHGLQPVFSQPGLYVADFPVSEAGAWEAVFSASLADGEQLEQTVWFSTFLEAGDRDNWPREAVLRDIARLSGGSYRHAADWDPAAPLAVSERVPRVARPWNWSRAAWFVALLLAGACAEWYGRRRLGLG
jgi:hypothetical protein